MYGVGALCTAHDCSQGCVLNFLEFVEGVG